MLARADMRATDENEKICDGSEQTVKYVNIHGPAFRFNVSNRDLTSFTSVFSGMCGVIQTAKLRVFKTNRHNKVFKLNQVNIQNKDN